MMLRDYNLLQNSIYEVAAMIAGEVIEYGKSSGWQGWKGEMEALSDILNDYNIFYTDRTYGTWEHQNSAGK